MNYTELEKMSQQRWITEGPNRDGVSGYLLVGESLYYFYEEPGMQEPKIVSEISTKEFLLQQAGTTHQRIAEMVTYLQNMR